MHFQFQSVCLWLRETDRASRLFLDTEFAGYMGNTHHIKFLCNMKWISVANNRTIVLTLPVYVGKAKRGRGWGNVFYVYNAKVNFSCRFFSLQSYSSFIFPFCSLFAGFALKTKIRIYKHCPSPQRQKESERTHAVKKSKEESNRHENAPEKSDVFNYYQRRQPFSPFPHITHYSRIVWEKSCSLKSEVHICLQEVAWNSRVRRDVDRR